MSVIVALAAAVTVAGCDQLKGPVGPAGPQGAKGDKGDRGDKGDTGDRGPAGPSNIRFVEGPTVTCNADETLVAVFCPSGGAPDGANCTMPPAHGVCMKK